MSTQNLISEFDAAQEIKMSPTLLRWFTSYAAKEDGRKLKFTTKDGIYFYDKKELLDFNSYLHSPWPKPQTGTRPSIPAGIATEIKTESNYRCPLCNTNIGELAHIKPVSKSFDNHPHNLIFLCPNHHTVYDFGFKYENISETDIVTHKKALQSFQSICWGMQSQIIFTYLSLINTIGRVKDIEETLLTANNQAEFDSLLKSILKRIDGLKLEKNQNKKIIELVESVEPEAETSSSEIAYAFLTIKEDIQKEYQEDKDLVECPLCDCKGWTELFEICPVCIGEGFINKNRDVDISIYEMENCPLCDGKGSTTDFEVCPPCSGEGQLTKEQVEDIDFSIYEMEDCPLCNGKGSTTDFEVCPTCHGDGQLTKEQIETIDLSIYEMEKCPLCKGKGQTIDFDTCPPCHGEGQLTKEQIENIDFSIYEMEECPLCKGRGQTRNYEICPPCHGEGQLTRDQIENIDFDEFRN